MYRRIATNTLTLLLALILSNRLLAADGGEERAVSIRIHDYAHIEDAALARAQEVVSGMYGKIGVRTEWLEPLQQSDGVYDDVGARSTPSDLVIIILTSAMADRGVIPDGTIGFAAVERGVGGRVAYVIYDRVRDFAGDTTVDDMRMMGIVMAHEIGHLLLAHQSHSAGGLMRGRWQQSEFRSSRPHDLHFSEPQAVEIRRTLRLGMVPLSQP
jgi:hypothetical protein